MVDSAPNQPIIHVEGFSKRYGKNTAVQAVDLNIGQGKYTVLSARTVLARAA